MNPQSVKSINSGAESRRQSLLNLRFELAHGGQVQLPAHLNCRDTRVEPAVLDFGPSQFRGATVVVERSDTEDTIRL